MNLPERVDDPSLLKYEPLRTYITIFECSEGQRSAANDSVSKFVKEMQQDGQAAAAAKKWVSLVFPDVLSDETSFEPTDGGESLYKVFFEYQLRLHRGLKQRNMIDKAHEYQVHIFRGGIKNLKLKDHGANVCHLSQGGGGGMNARKDQVDQRTSLPSGPKKALRQVEAGLHHADAGDECESYSATGTSTIQQGSTFDSPPVAGAGPSALSGVLKSNKCPTFKKKKRKASSQKPPVVTPSDVSEDDHKPPNTDTLTAPNPMSHRSKRIASDSSRQPHDLIEVKCETDTTRMPYRAGTDEQHDGGVIIVAQTQSFPSSSRSVDVALHSNERDTRNVILPFDGRKDCRRELFDASSRSILASLKFKKHKNVKSATNLQPHATKRARRASMSNPDNEAREQSEYPLELPRGCPPETTIEESHITDPQLILENTHVELQAQRKRTHLELETVFVRSDENASADSRELLGPDVRLLRPLPRKVRGTRILPVGPRVPCGASSLENPDHFLRDAASNALVIMGQGVEPDGADWIQDGEHDAECESLGGDDQDEANVSQDVTTIPATSKIPVSVPPRIWAQSRQEVCESFEYFRCYHSGVYSKNDIVRGYLLGAYAASRDIFHHDGKLIISHGGGKSESILDVRRGPKRYQTDQDQEATDKSVRALLKTYQERRPIVLLADDKYALFPYDLAKANYTYVVLGLYWISHAWAECQPARDSSRRIVRWKFAFQWCEGQGDPWWPRRENTVDPPKSIPKPSMSNTDRGPKVPCETCQEHSPFVYEQGWMCLNPRCDLFWIMNGGEPKQLDYREEFLTLLPQKFERLPNIIPSRAIEMPDGVTTTYAFTKGWHCTRCGRLSCRYKWECWECSNCKLTHMVSGRVRSPKEFWHQRPSHGFLHSQVGKGSGVLACRLEPISLGNHQGFTNRLTFILPHDRGKIHLILGTPLSNGDADHIFRLYQQQASTGELKLRRYPLRNHRARGLLLTNYFSQNSGEPYQYVGGSGQTVPFSKAPDCVRRSLALIKERSGLALHTDIPFNEVLSAAYMERQKMAFHSDSEKGLGPIVASLSLGSAALMHFRPHVNVENLGGKSSNALSLVLRHGDVLIMEGDGVQKYYEHTVVPMNFRIAATARCIGTG